MGKYSPKTYKTVSVSNKIIASSVNVNLYFIGSLISTRRFPYSYIDFLEFFFLDKFQSFSDKIPQTRSLSYDKWTC